MKTVYLYLFGTQECTSEAYLEGMKTSCSCRARAFASTSEAYLEGMKTKDSFLCAQRGEVVRSLPRRNENNIFSRMNIMLDGSEAYLEGMKTSQTQLHLPSC